MTQLRDYLGPFRLTRLIRVGNTCQVWEAARETDSKRFALKVLRPDFRTDRVEIAYLKHEFEVANKLRHPHIIRIFEYNDTAQTPFLVLELFDAQNLKQVLREGFDVLTSYVPKIVEQAAESLYYFHEEGWVHCDIKPDNFLVSGKGDVRLIDFTIALRRQSGLARKVQHGIKRIFNRSSVTRGTRSYMSPEQIRGHASMPSADIYSFGCVLFELVTARPPYTGESPNDLLKKHLSAQIPSAMVYNNNITPEFNRLIRRMLAKKPDARPPTMWDFLKEFRATRLFVKPPPPPEVELKIASQHE